MTHYIRGGRKSRRMGEKDTLAVTSHIVAEQREHKERSLLLHWTGSSLRLYADRV